MGQIERDRDAGHSSRREPVLGQPDVGPESDLPLGELLIELLDIVCDPRSLDLEVEVAEA